MYKWQGTGNGEPSKPIDVSAQVAATLDRLMLDWQGVIWCKTCQDFKPPWHNHDDETE